MALPIDVRDLLSAGSKVTAERDRPVGIAVLIEVDAPDSLVDELRARLRPETRGATLTVDVIAPDRDQVVTTTGIDAAVVVVGSGQSAGAALVAVRAARVPTVVLALGDHLRASVLGQALMHPASDVLVGEEPERLVADRLAGWLAGELPRKRLALAHNFSFVRRMVAEEAVKATALQNLLIGTVTIVPGTDMPLMTANQAKMVLQIAAAYGEHLGAVRVRELAAVVGGGFAFRAVARQLLGFVPVIGWIVKGGIGYAGTVAMGKLAIEYFEAGGDLSAILTEWRSAATRVVERVPRPRRLGAETGQLTLPVSAESEIGFE